MKTRPFPPVPVIREGAARTHRGAQHVLVFGRRADMNLTVYDDDRSHLGETGVLGTQKFHEDFVPIPPSAAVPHGGTLRRMNRPANAPTREIAKPDAAITSAKIALVGTIMAAIIGATATIAVALSQRTPTPVPPAGPSQATSANGSLSSKLPSTHATTSRTPVTPDGVTYQCAGSAPAGVDIVYGPSGSGTHVSSVPFTAHESVSVSTQYYSIRAQLQGDGDLTCTVTVTDAGRTTVSSGSAHGGYTIASPRICADFEGRWHSCG